MDISDRLKRELKLRNISPELLDLKCGLPKGTIDSVFQTGTADDPVIVKYAVALVDVPPSVLLYGKRDPKELWGEEDAQHAASLNAVWRKAIERRLTPDEAGQVFDRVAVAAGRYRISGGITDSMVAKACDELFPSGVRRMRSDDPHDDTRDFE